MGTKMAGGVEDMDMFALLDEALEDHMREISELPPDYVERALDPIVVPLANGDYHVCHRHNCKYVEATASDHQVVCSLSGISYGSDQLRDADPTWTGRSTSNGDPDFLSGTPVGGWRPRKDAFSESRRAFETADKMSSDQPVYVETAKEKAAREARTAPKRGALCVDEVREEEAPKRAKICRKSALAPESIEKLAAEATSILDKLMTPRTPAEITAAGGMAATTKPDPRLQNVEFVKGIALRRFVERCRKGEDRLDLNRLHDVFVSTNEFCRQQRLAARAREEAGTRPRRHMLSGETKRRVISLIIAIWRAACATPYFAIAKRGADSFRPFVSGCLYSTKRGLTLPGLGNLQVIPVLPSVYEQLPTLRSVDASSTARNLQSSSHRGICSLHRSVSSIAELEEGCEERNEIIGIFENAARVGVQLADFVNRS
jgi:hypothetical protein